MSASSTRKKVGKDARILFVIGTGRSGTHFLTRCVIGNQNIVDLMGGSENPDVFPLISNAAADWSLSAKNLELARRRYVKLADRASPKWFVDQSHPNVWFAEYWATVFPSSRFLGIIRKPHSVVNSMLKHRGVRRWVEQWERYPVPNRLLGINEGNKAAYAKMTVVERCTWRWIVHYQRLNALQEILGAKVLLVRYERLCEQPAQVLQQLSEWVGVNGDFSAVPTPDLTALEKYRELSSGDVESIDDMLKTANVPESAWKG